MLTEKQYRETAERIAKRINAPIWYLGMQTRDIIYQELVGAFGDPVRRCDVCDSPIPDTRGVVNVNCPDCGNPLE